MDSTEKLVFEKLTPLDDHDIGIYKSAIDCNTHVEKVDIVCRIFGYSFAGITLVNNFGMLFEKYSSFPMRSLK